MAEESTVTQERRQVPNSPELGKSPEAQAAAGPNKTRPVVVFLIVACILIVLMFATGVNFSIWSLLG